MVNELLVVSWAKVELRSITSTGQLLLGWGLWPQIASTRVLSGAVVSGTSTPRGSLRCTVLGSSDPLLQVEKWVVPPLLSER